LSHAPRRVFNAFAQIKGVAAPALRFLLDGERINGEQNVWMVSLQFFSFPLLLRSKQASKPLTTFPHQRLEDQDHIDCVLADSWDR
jgi:hypothetical protein